jgi:hypothetical protein
LGAQCDGKAAFLSLSEPNVPAEIETRMPIQGNTRDLIPRARASVRDPKKQAPGVALQFLIHGGGQTFPCAHQ